MNILAPGKLWLVTARLRTDELPESKPAPEVLGQNDGVFEAMVRWDLFGAGMDADSARRAWAVGTYTNDGNTYQSLILRWNGGSWTRATSSNPGTASDGFQGITALSGSNAWAVGRYSNGGTDKTLIEHWKGASWKVVKSPNPGGNRYEALFGVTAISPSDAWATGSYVVGTTYMTMILHWNGFSWKQVKSPSKRSVADSPPNVAMWSGCASPAKKWLIGSDARAADLA